MHPSRYSSEYYARRRGGRKNEFEGNKISVRIRGKKVGEKKKKKRNCAEERYTDLSIALLVKIISSWDVMEAASFPTRTELEGRSERSKLSPLYIKFERVDSNLM